MEANVDRLLHEAMRLPAEARAALAGQLLESLDSRVDSDAEAAWGEEIARRLEEIDAGEVQTVPWAQARRQILGERGAATED